MERYTVLFAMTDHPVWNFAMLLKKKVLYDDNGKALGWKNGEEILVYPDTRAGKRIKATHQYGVRGWTEADKVWY